MALSTDQLSWMSRHVPTRRGRPWAEKAVWVALWLLSTGETPDWLADHHPSRIRRRLQTIRPSGLLWAVRPRAVVHRFRATERVLAAMRAHVLVSGAGALGEDVGGLRLEGYVTPERFDWLSSDFPIVPDDSTPNLVLRVTKFASEVEGETVPIGFAAADMAGSGEPLEAERGWLILDDLLRSFTEEQRDWLTAAEIAAAITGEVDRGDEIFALRVLAKALSDVRSLSEPADIIGFLQKPPSTGDRRWDVLVASAVARECRLWGLDAPQWTDVESLEPWWFPALIDETLLPLTIQRTPPELARKGVWLDERALEVI
jgi:hypothetical protein